MTYYRRGRAPAPGSPEWYVVVAILGVIMAGLMYEVWRAQLTCLSENPSERKATLCLISPTATSQPSKR